MSLSLTTVAVIANVVLLVLVLACNGAAELHRGNWQCPLMSSLQVTSHEQNQHGS